MIMTNLQKVIQDKTKQILTQEFSEYVENNIGINYNFDPIDWQPDYEIISEKVITNEEVIEATEEFVQEHAKTILAEVKEEERQYQQEKTDEERYIASHQPQDLH